MSAAATTLGCPVCERVSSSETPEVITDTGYGLIRCGGCAVLFTDARNAPPASELYPAFDQSRSAGAATASRRAVGGFLKRRVAIASRAATSGRSLDFGAGGGAFARAMAASGYESVGLEPFSLGVTESSASLRLVRAPLDEVADALGLFDVITLWHVLEHLHDPVPVLGRLGSMLTSNGALVVCVPNERSWQRRVFRRSWFHLDPPRHLMHFDPNTLRAALASAGLDVRESVPFVPEYGMSGWTQSALNRVLPHRNFLYEVVKDRGALSTMSRGAFVASFTASLVIGAPVALLSWPIEWLAARREASATVTYIATVAHRPAG
jgi:SAM-dependent methyltransferase